MSSIGKNIKKIRSIKKLSQTGFADIFGLGRASVGAYEEGRAEPKIETIIQIANYFGISIDLLLTKELTVNELFSFNIFQGDKKPTEALKADLEGARNMMVYIPVAQRLEYCVKCDNRSYLANLPTLKLPKNSEGDRRAFEMEGSAMEHNHHGIFHSDIVIGKRIPLEEPTNIAMDQVYVLVTEGGLHIRRIEHSSDAEAKKLLLRADNPDYEWQELNFKHIKEAWEVIGKFSSHLEPPLLLEERILRLEEAIDRLNNR